MDVGETGTIVEGIPRASRWGQALLLGIGGVLAGLATWGALRSLSGDFFGSDGLHLAAAGFAVCTGTAALWAGLERSAREGRRRRYFLSVTVGLAIWLYGQGLGYVLTTGAMGTFDPRVEAVPLAFALPLTMYGTLGLSKPAAMDRRSSIEALVDAFLGGVALLVIWAMGVIPLWADVPDEWFAIARLDQLMLLAGATGFVTLITFSRSSGSLPLKQLSMFIGGLLVILISDLAGEVGPDRSTDVTLSLIGYWLGVTLIIGMFHRSSAEAEPAEHTRLRLAIAVAIPFGLVLVAGLLLIRNAQQALPDSVILAVMPLLWTISVVALGVSRASSERSDRSQRLSRSTELLAGSAHKGWIGALLRDSSEYVFVLDAAGGIVYSSPRTQEMLAQADRFRDLLADAEPDSFDGLLRGLLAGVSPPGPYEMRLRGTDGQVRDVETQLRIIKEVSFEGFVLTAIDVTESRQLLASLDLTHRHDTLTGLLTRDAFLSEVITALQGHHPVGLAVLDLNDLGVWNETLGRSGGDAILQAVARRLDVMSDEVAAMSRISGDGFALLVIGTHPQQVIESTLERLASGLRGLLLADDTEVDISFRAGYSVTPPEVPAQQLMDQADVALRRSRSSRRSMVVGFQPGMNDALVRRLATEQGIRDALARDRVLVHYQPIARLDDGVVTGLEALIRLRAADGAVIPPGEFIPTAADAGLVNDLDRQVRRIVANDWLDLARASGQEVRINLNVHEMELSDALIKELLDLDLADKVAIEVTEDSLLSRPDEAIAALASFRSVGGVVAIDDFGTGYSSLSQIVSLPCDVVKIDRSFVANMAHSRGAMSLVRATITMAHDLGLTVVAEGVETAEEAAALQALGCDRIQGYFLTRPLPLPEVLEWLVNRAAP